MSIPDSARTAYHAGKRIRKLQPRAWIGYLIGCKGDANVRVYNPEKNKVKRVDIADIIHGEKTDNPQQEGTQTTALRRTNNNNKYLSDDTDDNKDQTAEGSNHPTQVTNNNDDQATAEPTRPTHNTNEDEDDTTDDE